MGKYVGGAGSTRRSAYGLAIGTDVEAYSTLLASIAAHPVTTKGDLLAATGNAAVDRLAAGSNGKILVADSSAATGLAWADAYAALMLKGKSGYYYFTASQGNSTTTATHGNGTLRLHPEVIPAGGITIDRVGAEVTSAGNAASVVRLGCYADDGTGYPGALIADFGTIDGTSATVQTITVSQAIPAGLVWWGAAAQNAATTQPTLRAVSGNSIPVFIPSGTSAPGSGTSIQGWQMASVSGALPTLSGLATSGAMARLFYRVA